MPFVALVRGVPDTFHRALRRVPVEIDVARARAQHRAYVDALRQVGVEVVELPADPAFPDCCFVEDTAVCAGGALLLTRPGAPSRQGEVQAVAEALGPRASLRRMEPPATLDGGDCLLLGRTFHVGMSERTGPEGAAFLDRVFGPLGYEVRRVEVPDALHLKSVCSAISDRSLLLAEGTVDPRAFVGAEVVTIPAEEAPGANCVALPGVALVADGFPSARRAVERAGLRAVPVDTSELRKADGALTCLSILLAP